jgi:hypothetical protein
VDYVVFCFADPDHAEGELSAWVVRIPEYRYIDNRGDKLLEQFESFPCDLWAKKADAGDIAARTRKAGNKSEANRIGAPPDQRARGHSLAGLR